MEKDTTQAHFFLSYVAIEQRLFLEGKKEVLK